MSRSLLRLLFVTLLLVGQSFITVAAPAVNVSVTSKKSNRFPGKGFVATLTLPQQLNEGDTSAVSATVTLNRAPTKALTVTLSASPAGQIAFPSTVIVPARKKTALFNVSAIEDNKIEGNVYVTVTATAAGMTSATGTIAMADNEPQQLSITLPSPIREGTTATAAVYLDRTMAAPLSVKLTAEDPALVNIPATVIIPAYSTWATFAVFALDNNRIEGGIPIKITAEVAGLNLATAEATLLDSEGRLLRLLLPSSISEGGTATATVTTNGTLTTALTVNLTTTNETALTVPVAVTIPAGSDSTTFLITAQDNALLDGNRSVTINAAADTFTGAFRSITIIDNENALQLLLAPSVTEGETAVGTVAISRPLATPLTVNLTSGDETQLTVPAAVTIPAGSISTAFSITALDNAVAEGDRQTTITASAESFFGTTMSIAVIDNEPVLSISVPAIVQEGVSYPGSVATSKVLATDLAVGLTSTDDSTVAVPATVTIPAGSTSAMFDIAALDNMLRDGTRGVVIRAAVDGYLGAAKPIIVRDNDVASYRFNGLTDIVNVSDPVNITVLPLDVEGNVINSFSGSVNLDLLLPDGSVQGLTPFSVTVHGITGWTGSVTWPAVWTLPLRLRATDSDGITGDSGPFDIMHVLKLQTADIISDNARNLIYASVPQAASSVYSNHVVAIDPTTLQITAAVPVQDPGPLALTGGAEALYAGLNSNGSIAKIDLDSINVVLTFAVGFDSSWATLFAEDICTVADQPNLVVISQYRKGLFPRYGGVAVYDNGVIRSNKIEGFIGCNRIEPSADPNLFFGYESESSTQGLHQLRLDANGITDVAVKQGIVGEYSPDIMTEGNTIVSTLGAEADGANMQQLGTFTATAPGAACPDLRSNRVYFVEAEHLNWLTYDKISAFDPNSFSAITRLTLPKPLTLPASYVEPVHLIRWGSNGLAFRTPDSIVFVNSARLVPTDAPADLHMTMDATPNPAYVGDPLTYTVHATNHGPNIARNTLVAATFSDFQTIQTAHADIGNPMVSGSTVSLAVGDLAVGASVTLTVATSPRSAGALSCSASANSQSADPDYTNNSVAASLPAGFHSVVNATYLVRILPNNIIYDPTRNLLWATIPESADSSADGSLVAVDPLTGFMSEPFPIGIPFAGCIALSQNGRYLYIGRNDVSEILRIDLNSAPYDVNHIPVGNTSWGSPNYAAAIEVLDGDGTSFLFAGSQDRSAAVIDGTMPRPNRTGLNTVGYIERTTTPDVFFGYTYQSATANYTRLVVTASGVAIQRSAPDPVNRFREKRSSSGDNLLFDTGMLLDTSTFAIKANFNTFGTPCFDSPNARAYFVNGNALRIFDTSNAALLGTLPLPVNWSGDWAQLCIRWGQDGFAILGSYGTTKDGRLHIGRSSSAIPPAAH